MSVRAAGSGVVVGLALAGCDPIARLGSDLPDKAALMRGIGTEVIVPTHAALSDRLTGLDVAMQAWCAAPDAAGLAGVQEAWRAARLPLATGEAFAFGPPVDDDRLLARLDFAPVRTLDVDMLLAGDEPVDAAALAGRGTTVRGLPVIEYLLFSPGGSEQVLAATTARRCDYLRGLTGDAAASGAALRAAWEGGLAERLGGGAEPWATPQAAMADVVNTLIGHAETLRIARLGKPAGVYGEGGVPDPEALRSPWARHALPELVAGVEGIAAVYGEGERGLAALVAALSPQVDEALRSKLQEAHEALLAVPGPLDEAIVAGAAEVGAAYEAVYAVQRELATSMASTLGVTVTFTDNDGD